MATLTQAMTGFNNLAYHSGNKDNNISPRCRLCDADREEFLHLVNECPLLNAARENTFGPTGLTGNWTFDQLKEFIENPCVKFLLENRKENEENELRF